MDESWIFKGPPQLSRKFDQLDQLFFTTTTDMPSSPTCPRWRCHGRPVSQHSLPAPGGTPLPQPLNVLPSLSLLPVRGLCLVDTTKDSGNLSTKIHAVTREVIFQLFPLLEYVCGNRQRKGENWKWTKTSLIHPQKRLFGGAVNRYMSTF